MYGRIKINESDFEVFVNNFIKSISSKNKNSEQMTKKTEF